MKKIPLLILAILSWVNISLYAQQTNDFKYTADSLFQHLDKTGVSTGVLYDRVFPSAALNNFNLNLPDTSSIWHFVQGYSEYYRSAYNPSSSWITVN